MRIPRELSQALRPVHTISEDLKSFIQQLGGQPETCVTCLDESEIMYRTLLRPFSDRKKITETISSEVETLLPSMDSRLVVDFVLMGKDNSGSHIIQSLSARTTSVQNLVTVCRNAGLDPEIVDCPSASIAAGARALLELPDDQIVVVVHMGWSESSVAVLMGKTIKYIGSLPLGFERVASADTPGDAQATAALIEKMQSGTIDPGERLTAFFREVSIMLEKSGELEGDQVLLATGYAHLIKDLPQRAQASLGMGVLAPTLKDITFEGSMDDLLPGFLSASLACRGFDETDETNFRQGELGLAKHMKKLKGFAGPWVKAALVLLVIWIFGLSLDVILMARTNAGLTKKINAEFASVMPKGTPLVDPIKQMEQQLGRLSGSSGALDGAPADSPLEILKDLSAGIPATIDVVFDSINIDQESITLSGSTTSYNNVEQMQAIIAKLPYVKEVKIVSANVDKTDQKVKLKLVCKK
jgi:Tfp pilus assembly PilM family ATPase